MGTAYLIGPLESLPEGEMAIFEFGEAEIGVMRVGTEIKAYENVCPHQGGPVCYGSVLGRQEAILDAERRVVGERISSETYVVSCPWHGFSFDVRTGQNIVDQRYRLRAWQVTLQDGQVYVTRSTASKGDLPSDGGGSR